MVGKKFTKKFTFIIIIISKLHNILKKVVGGNKSIVCFLRKLEKAYLLWKAISLEPLSRFKCYLYIWILRFKTNNLSTFGDMYDPPFESSYALENCEKMRKIDIFKLNTTFK